MKLKFVKNVTVDIRDQHDNTDEKSIRSGSEIDVVEVVPISEGFSDILLASEECLVCVRNDSFRRLV